MKKGFVFLCALFASVVLPASAEAAALAIAAVAAAAGAGVGGLMGFTGLALFQAAAWGWSIGAMLGNILFAPKGPTQHGPRLQDRHVQSSAYNAHIIKHWGCDRFAGNVIWASEIKEHAHKKTVGKGGGGSTTVTYTYTVDLRIAFCKKAKLAKRIWAGPKIVYSVDSGTLMEAIGSAQTGTWTFFTGDETQLPSALEEADKGAGDVPAYRGLFIVEVKDFDLELRAIPNFTAEVCTEGEAECQVIESYVPTPDTNYRTQWTYVGADGEIYAWQQDVSGGGGTGWPNPTYNWINHYFPDGTVVREPIVPTTALGGNQADILPGQSDEPSYMNMNVDGNQDGRVYYRIHEQSATRLLDLADTSTQANGQQIWAKEGEDIYIFNPRPVGDPKNYIMHWHAETGNFIDMSPVIKSMVESGHSVCKLSLTESYLYVLMGNATVDKIVKIARSDLTSIVATYNLTGFSGDVGGLFAENDQKLHFSFQAGGGFGVAYYDTTSNSIVEVCPAVTPEHATINPGHPDANYLYVRNGLYFLGTNGRAGLSTAIDIIGTGGAGECIPLWKIVRDIERMGGLDVPITANPPTTGDINVSELTDCVHGYSLTRQMNCREALIPLQQVYTFDGRESDGLIQHPKRGKAAVETLTQDDLAARKSLDEELPDRLTIVRKQETELPFRVLVGFNNHTADYQPGHEYASRLISETKEILSVEIGVAITPDEAKRTANMLQALAWLEREQFTAKVSRKHLLPDPADNVEITITETA